MDVGLVLPMGDDDRPGVPVSGRSIVELARVAETGGLDSLWVYDHLLEVGADGRVGGQWEAWTLLGALASATERAALGTLVSCTSFRSPGLLAKMAHTVQEISGGRLILGLGAGWHQPEYRAFGYPFDRRVARFAEAIEIIVPLLRGETVNFVGQFYTVTDCVLLPELTAVPELAAAAEPASSGPAAATAPGRLTGVRVPPILVGTKGPRMMRLTARWADAWNGAWYGMPSDVFARSRDDLHAACAAAGRDPSTIDITVGMVIGGERPGRLELTAAAVAQALTAWHQQGVAHVLCWPDPTDRAGVEVIVEGARQYRGQPH
jgi:alkanesulfonate monooxygenase SsuD/methylene tetrahydromethanopterin reductase-like flavin-dependent oxidoreductase (luciferase family)